ncbi:FAD-binding oxidoreductase [Saccharopolyspora karakumensis]|uniref:FAD-binding oxidoreductase n=1 Tax=Saccharopolyspora karakumensis TaxID=2530386 RepID=A0A4R5BYN1_9PSEU|nr:FAD-dependent oxidoreductase [Saccharopolyspora karakumensis]TDD90540.1 FAD-binding oxidoreductase [Saccharopolyspora karakumensis]
MKNGEISYWRSNAGASSANWPRLDEDLNVDVAIIGGGLTGLWTAWVLKQRDPSLEVAVFEGEEIGYGASGRNGGWLSAKPVGMRRVLARGTSGRAGVLAIDRVLASSIHEIVEILGASEIDAHHGGWLEIARSRSELARIKHHLMDAQSWGVEPERVRLLGAEEVRNRVKVSGALGGLYSPDNYRVDPYKLVLAVANLAASSGAAIYTSSRVHNVTDGRRLRVGDFTVRARQHIVVATEGYSGRETGRSRSLLPMNSAMMVTEPLTDEQWRMVGWESAEGIRGVAHTFFYGQRTPDGRIAIGGRGHPYRFASKLDHDGRVDEKTVTALSNLLRDLFPQVSARPVHAWCGVIGVTRDWSPFVDTDPSNGITRVGGYAGQGLTASYVGARIVADLLCGKSTELTELPWVRPMPRRWEPEPLRWVGAHGLYKAYSIADRMEARRDTERTAWPARLADRIAGR